MAASVKIDVSGLAETLREFEQLAEGMKFKVLDKGIRKASQAVVRRAKALAPKSSETGTAKKRSKKQATKADWATPLHTTITYKLRQYQNKSLGVAGPSWPKGNKAQFNWGKNVVESGRQHFYWGRGPGRYKAPENWMRRALDETRSEQLAAIREAVQEAIREAGNGG